jgi:hypothetical protein
VPQQNPGLSTVSMFRLLLCLHWKRKQMDDMFLKGPTDIYNNGADRKNYTNSHSHPNVMAQLTTGHSLNDLVQYLYATSNTNFTSNRFDY